MAASVGKARITKSQQKRFEYLYHEVIGNSMFVHFLDAEGEPTVFAFGNGHSKREYIVVAYCWGGRMYDGAPPHIVSFLLYREGSPTTAVSRYTDGEPLNASHSFTVVTTKEIAREIALATGRFMYADDDARPEGSPKHG